MQKSFVAQTDSNFFTHIYEIQYLVGTTIVTTAIPTVTPYPKWLPPFYSVKFRWLCCFSRPLMVLNCGCSAVRISSNRIDSAVVKVTLGVFCSRWKAIFRSYALH